MSVTTLAIAGNASANDITEHFFLSDEGSKKVQLKAAPETVKKSAIAKPEVVKEAPEVDPEPEMAILHVTLNTADAGEHFMAITADGDVLLQAAVLQAIGLPDVEVQKISVGRKAASEDDQLSLRAMAPKLAYKLDAQAGELTITANPAILAGRMLDLNTRKPSEALLIQDTAAFVNYTLNYNRSRGSKGQVVAPFELGLNVAGLFASGNFTYQQGQAVVRTQSQLVYEIPDMLQRWELGDIQASAGPSGGGALGGIRLSSNFGIKPELLTLPSLELQTMLATPSDVEVYINGNLVSKESVPAGSLIITNPPFYGGAGDAVLVVRDAFGREQRYDYSFYTSSSLLAPGLHDYNYAFGWPQQRTNSGQIQYGGKATLMGFHRYGVNDWLTAGLGGELNGSNLGLNTQITWLPGRLGQLDFSLAGSRRASLQGFSGLASYSYQGSGLVSPSLTFRWQTPHFGSVLADSIQAQTQRWNAGINLGIGLDKLGSLSGRFSLNKNFDHSSEKKASILFSTSVMGKLSLSAQAIRAWNAGRSSSEQYNLNINYPFDNGLYLSAGFSLTDGVKSFNIQLLRSLPFGDGFGYRASADGGQDSDLRSTQELQYQNSYGEVAVNRSGSAKNPAYGARLSSALLLAGGRAHISRPVRNGFAVVRVGEMANVKVQFNHQPVGETDSRGVLVVPHMIAYSDNDISIDADNVPLGYSIDATSRIVTSSFRGGGLVEFKVAKLQVLEGKAFYRIGGEKKEAQYSGLELVSDDEKVQAIIGYGGVFYMENIQAGNYEARIFNETRDCHFKLTVPESESLIVDLGDVVCEIGATRKKE